MEDPCLLGGRANFDDNARHGSDGRELTTIALDGGRAGGNYVVEHHREL